MVAIRSVADVGNISIVYLLAVLASAIAFGSRSAVLAALGSFLAYNFFFLDPHYRFTVADEEEWIELVALLITGVATGQLAAALRQRAIEASGREKEAVVLYDVVSLMTEPDIQRALTAVAERLRVEAELAAVVIVLGTDQSTRVQADVGDVEAIRLAQEEAADMILAYGNRPTGAERGSPGRWVRLVQPGRPVAGARPRSRRVRSVGVELQERRVGTVVMVRRPGAAEFSASEDRLVSAIARQLSLTLERLRLQQEATEIEIFRRTDELRTALINAVSHDLRTPLSSIMASAGSLRQTDVAWSEADRIELGVSIEAEAARLNRLVGNLLDLSRIEAGALRPEKGWYDIRSLIREVIGRARGTEESHRIVSDLGEELPPLHFDYVEIDQVITNLIENAVKYAPSGTEIRVSVRLVGSGGVEVEVSDEGGGIAEVALPHVFDAFYRAPDQTSRAAGSGLGLAVARGLVEAHGGSIRVENRPEGGARFSFTLPLTDDLPELGAASQAAG
jgi:two-component system sensor histidine kinase KdpD